MIGSDAQPPGLAGAVMVGIDGEELSDADRSRLELRAVGGVCLFGRNYRDISQLGRLVADIRAAAPRRIVVAVDQEGGSVQRFKPPDFAEIPPAGELGDMYRTDPAAALETAAERGEGISRSLATVNVDLTFAPVLDIDYSRNDIVGRRAFSDNPTHVAALAMAFCAGLAAHGCKAVGKHFPGHGWTRADTHTAEAFDEREAKQIMDSDILPYISLIKRKLLAAVMASHVVYPAVDSRAATFSEMWLRRILREKLGFSGPVMTDDLFMHAAGGGALADRATEAFQAGCDLLLLCGAEPVLADRELRKLPALGGSEPWLPLARAGRDDAG